MAHAACLLGRTHQAGGQNDLDGGMMLANPAGEREPVLLARHLHVAEHQVYRHLGREHRPCLGNRAGLEDAVAAVAQIFGDHQPHQHPSSTTRMVCGTSELAGSGCARVDTDAADWPTASGATKLSVIAMALRAGGAYVREGVGPAPADHSDFG